MKRILSFLLILPAIAIAFPLTAQTTACPDVTASPDTTMCGTGCATITAVPQGTVGTTSYGVSSIPFSPFPTNGSNQILINIDDVWSGVIPMPFCFEFFGQTYNSILIGSNAIVTFDLTQANGYCQWPINNAIPSALNPMNSIMAPFHDIDPSVPNSGTDINWEVYGTAPCRQFVISWDSVPMFSCNNIIASSQLVLHETTNIIDVYLDEKPVCSSWNAGAAILGIQDATGTTAYFPPGYNYPAQWTASNEGWRFTPTGASNYTFGWYDMSGNLLSNSTSYQVCPPTTTSYVAVISNTSCAGNIIATDTVTVTVGTSTLSTVSTTTPDICAAGIGTATTTPNGQPPYTYVWQPGGQTTQTATGLSAGVYTVTIIDGTGCGTTDTVIVPGTSTPVNPVITSNALNGIINQPTPGAQVQICFSNTSPGSVNSWAWVYDGTQTSSQQSPCFTESDSGLVCVTLAVTDTNNCADTATLCVRVQSEAVFSFPNVFTPNGDGSNDIFIPTTIGVKDVKCTVYDRWGMEVYSWIGVTNGWNGKTTQGKEAVDGVYYWVATVIDYQDDEFQVSGFVHLIRGK